MENHDADTELSMPYPGIQFVADIRWRDGSILRDVLVMESGKFAGIVVGGHDGVAGLPPEFNDADIVAICRKDGFWRWLGFRRWVYF